MLRPFAVGLALLSVAPPALCQHNAEAAPAPALNKLIEILDQIKARYVERIDDQKLIADAINGVLKGLDTHSAYLDPKTYRELQRETRGRFGGLGMEVGMESGMLKVIAAFEDSPAARAGLKPGDRITRMDDLDVASMTLEQAIHYARGEPDTQITLAVLQEGDSEPRLLILTRRIVQTPSVQAKWLEPGIAHVRLSHFRENTPERLASAVRALMTVDAAAMQGLVLDLRDNPGGLVRSAVAVSAAFLPTDALVVYTAGAGDKSRMRLHARRDDYLRGDGDDYLKQLPAEVKTVPMVVLVNGGSASAAEIVAGALQDHKRATIIGTRTYGKGSVQALIPLAEGGALKLTTAYYFSPSGRSIQAKGVVPDVVAEVSDAKSTDTATPTTVVAERHAGTSSARVTPSACTRFAAPTPGGKEAQAASSPSDSLPLEGIDCQLDQAREFLRNQLPLQQRDLSLSEAARP